MKDDSVFKKRVYPVIFMFVITAVFIAVVSSIHLSTQEMVRLNERLYIREAVLFAAGIDIPDTPQEITEVYNQRIEEVTGGPAGEEVQYMRILDSAGNQVTGYATFVSGAGLWGEIRAVLAFEDDLETIRGVDFIKQNETPGLGARIKENWFKNQFRGKSLPLTLVAEDTADEPSEIDQLTGATVTSTAVMDLIQKGTERIQTLVEEGQQ
jgi:Na+-transporting NADH:ubiquinone oxidoreductase subunit C